MTFPHIGAKPVRKIDQSDVLRVLAVLDRVRGLDAEIIFPGQKRGKGLSNMAMTQLMRRLGRGDVMVRGFRSSLRDWAEERGGMPCEIAELSLAHELGNATERAYRRSDLLTQAPHPDGALGAVLLPGEGRRVEIGGGGHKRWGAPLTSLIMNH